jgi:hypothetical protein
MTRLARVFVTVAAPAASGATSAAADYGPVSAALRPEVDDLRALTAVIDTSAQRAESAICLAVRVTGGIGEHSGERSTRVPSKVASARSAGVTATVSDRSSSAACMDRSTNPDGRRQGCRFILKERCRPILR